MPNNESSVKKRKDFVSDSGLWVNNKDIDKSVFITDQQNKKWKWTISGDNFINYYELILFDWWKTRSAILCRFKWPHAQEYSICKRK